MIGGFFMASSVFELLFWFVWMFFYIDFYGGVLHHVLDEPANLELPIIGTACLEFQWHHIIPHDISSEPWFDVIGALNVLGSIKWIWMALIVAATTPSTELLKKWVVIASCG